VIETFADVAPMGLTTNPPFKFRMVSLFERILKRFSNIYMASESSELQYGPP